MSVCQASVCGWMHMLANVYFFVNEYLVVFVCLCVYVCETVGDWCRFAG